METIRKHSMDKYHFLKLLLVMYIHVCDSTSSEHKMYYY